MSNTARADYCGSSAATSVWNEDGSLSICFVDGVLFNLLYMFMLLAFTYRLLQLRSEPGRYAPFTWVHYVVCACHVVLAGLPLVALVYGIIEDMQPYQTVWYCATATVWVYSLVVINFEYSKAKLHNWTTMATWLLAFILSAVQLQSMVSLFRKENEDWWELAFIGVQMAALTVVTILVLFLNSIPGVKQDDYHKLTEEERILQRAAKKERLLKEGTGTEKTPLLEGKGQGGAALLAEGLEKSPEQEANVISQATYWWLSPLLKMGYERVLEEEDLYALCDTDKARYNSDLFEKHWDAQVASGKAPSIPKALFASFGLKFCLAGVLKLLNDILTFVGPFALNRIVSYIQYYDTKEAMEPWQAWMWVGIMALGQLSLSFVAQYYFLMVFRIAMKTRAAIVTVIYKKAFKLANTSRQDSTTGEIVNHMSIDAQRLMDLIPYLHQLWSGPLQILLCLVVLFLLLKWALLAGIVLMVALIPFQGWVVKHLKALQIEIMLRKDKRVKVMNELLQGMRVIKFFAWEDSFKGKVEEIRDLELLALRKAAYLQSFVMFMWMSTPLFVSILTFATYSLFETLDATTAFTALSLFNILRFPLNVLPQVIAYLVDAIISFKRLTAFLVSDEVDPEAVKFGSFDQAEDAIRIKDGEFTWDAANDSFLKEIDFELRRGELAAVVGAVGSGKSSLMAAILGDILKRKGDVHVNGSMAYAAQEAWIQNATVRDNILFGLHYDAMRYERAIRVCELEQDLDMLPAGDATEIGEKGVNLSGGQKQRVSMARAVYANADIYLLDDPLSAVDAHVGKAMFDNCICDALQAKSRLLITHQLQHLSKVDRIWVMKDGKFTECGTYKQLMADDGEFCKLIRDHVSEGKQETEDEGDAAEEADAPEKEKKAATSKLIQTEEREVGEVSISVYRQYITALGGIAVCVFLIFFFLFEQLSKTAADWWLSYWSDNASDPNGLENWEYIAIYAAIGGANGFFVLSRSLLFAFASLNSAKSVHEKLLDNVLHIPMAFFDTTPVGRILNRFSKDQYTIDQTLPRTMAMFMVMIFATLAILLVIGAVTPFFLTAVIPLAYIYKWVQNYYIRSSRELKRIDSTTRSPIFSQFGETLTGVATIKAYDREGEFIVENEAKLDHNQRAYWAAQAANRWLGLRLEFLGMTVITLASFFCVVEADNLEAGSAGLALTYALQTTALLNWLVRMYTEVESQMVAVERLVDYSTVPREADSIIPSNRPDPSWPKDGRIRFDNLQLRYREGLPLVLKGVTCEIEPGQKVGVVGRTGAGKSTLMLALFRLVEPAGGAVVVDGIDISRIGLHDLRKKISIIPQDPTLFTGTVRSNMDPFDEFSDADIWAALRAVHLDSVVGAYEDKLEGKMAEGGSNLSVGQRQLMCLGRALLRKCKIIVMDEATASVDFETDSLIQTTIRVEFKDCTVLTIAHRIHTIEDYDRVMVLDAGVVAEFEDPRVLKQDSSSLFYGMASKSGTSHE